MDLIVLFIIGVILIYVVNKYTKSKLCPKCNSKKIIKTLELGHSKDDIIKYIKEDKGYKAYLGGARYEYKCSDCAEVWHKIIDYHRKLQKIYRPIVQRYKVELEEQKRLESEEYNKKYRENKKYYKIE